MDPLVEFLARVNCAVFWFHPLSWWLERKLVTTAEHACDDQVVRELGEPRAYAGILLEIAAAVHQRGERVSWQGIGVEGRGTLPARIERLLQHVRQDVSVFRRVVVVLLCLGTIYAAAACQSGSRSDDIAQLRQEVAELRAEIRKNNDRPANSDTEDPNSRNPFKVRDVRDPNGADVRAYARTIDFLGKAGDANSEEWVKSVTAGDTSSIDGEWTGRWNHEGNEWVPSYRAQVKSVGDRVYILYRDHQGRFLADLHRENNLLVGRLVGVDNPGDSSTCVIQIVGNDRLDGAWQADRGNPRGRLDFRRRLK
jgi:hypothetical protein